MVALGILAFRRGGAVSVGIAGLSRMLPAAVVSPLSSFLGDRYRRNVLLIWVQVAWALALAGSWLVVVAHGPTPVLYALAGVTGICMALFRGVVISLIPWLARTADELVSSNVVASMIEGLGTRAGPLVGGLVAATAGPEAVGRLGGPLALGVFLWGLPVAVVGIWARPAVALVALGVVGVGNALMDVAGLTLLQRLVPDERLSRVVGVLLGGAMAAVGVGSIVTPELISWLGLDAAMGVVGGAVALCAIVALPRLRRIDRDAGAAPPEVELRATFPPPLHPTRWAGPSATVSRNAIVSSASSQYVRSPSTSGV